MNTAGDSNSPCVKNIRWDRHEVAAALDTLEREQSGILDYLTLILNGYHQSKHDKTYYDLLCGEWLLTFSHVVYAAYLQVERDIPQVEFARTIPAFSDYNQFQGSIVEDPLQSEQIAAHVNWLLGEQNGGNIRWHSRTIQVSNKTGSNWRRRMRDWKSGALRAFAKNDSKLILCRPHVDRCSRRAWYATLWKWRKWAREENFDYPLESSAEVDVVWRTKMSCEQQGTTFVEILRRMLPLYLPVAYVEAFADLRAQAHALRIPRPQAIYTANSLHGHTLFKLLAADWRADGTKILNHQHGGNYGLDRVHAVENYETRVCDRFFTLGWTGESAKQTVLPGALSPKSSRATGGRTKILLNCIAYPPSVFRIHFQPMPGTIETMLEQSAAFVQEMKGRCRMTLRPSPNDYAMRTVDSLSAIDASMVIDNMETSGIHSYLESDLVVHSYLGSSWLETLALDIPTVCFYDPETYAWREDSFGLVQALMNVGILHESGREAAKFVLTVQKDPKLWWKKSDVQDARSEFVSRYARFSTEWPALWENEFFNWTN